MEPTPTVAEMDALIDELVAVPLVPRAKEYVRSQVAQGYPHGKTALGIDAYIYATMFCEEAERKRWLSVTGGRSRNQGESSA